MCTVETTGGTLAICIAPHLPPRVDPATFAGEDGPR